MTFFTSLKDLLAFVYNYCQTNREGILIGSQSLESNPQVLNTTVVFYTSNGTFYHQSTVANEPINEEKIKVNQELYKALNINNQDIQIKKDPDFVIDHFEYYDIKYTELLQKLKEVTQNLTKF